MTNNSAVSEFVFKYIVAVAVTAIALMALCVLAAWLDRSYIIYGPIALIGVGTAFVAIKTALDDPIGINALHLPVGLFIALLCLMVVSYGAYGS